MKIDVITLQAVKIMDLFYRHLQQKSYLNLMDIKSVL